jgi:hypothetical protein
MHAQATWKEFDQDMRAKFEGQYGQMAYREAVSVAFMIITHKVILKGVEPAYHPHLAGNFASEADDYFRRPLQDKLRWIDTHMVPAIERFIDHRASDLDRFVDVLNRRAS